MRLFYILVLMLCFSANSFSEELANIDALKGSIPEVSGANNETIAIEPE